MDGIERYDLMMGNDVVGDFIVDNTGFGRKFKIVLNDDYSKDYKMMKLCVLSVDGVIDDEHTRFWMSRRVMPRNRINGDELLRSKGIYEYDVYAIFKSNNGATRMDYNWVRFIPGMLYQDIRPLDADSILKIIEKHKREGVPPMPRNNLNLTK